MINYGWIKSLMAGWLAGARYPRTHAATKTYFSESIVDHELPRIPFVGQTPNRPNSSLIVWNTKPVKSKDARALGAPIATRNLRGSTLLRHLELADVSSVRGPSALFTRVFLLRRGPVFNFRSRFSVGNLPLGCFHDFRLEHYCIVFPDDFRLQDQSKNATEN